MFDLYRDFMQPTSMLCLVYLQISFRQEWILPVLRTLPTTLAKDFASTCEEYTEDSFREIIHNESLVLNDGVTKKLFIWRDKQRDFTKGMSELCRIIPDPTETFNGPVFKVASGWDKLVSKCHFFELF